jgi:hypothetical protein
MQRYDVLGEIAGELTRQTEKWGEQNHPNGTGYDYLQIKADAARIHADVAAEDGTLTWHDILKEEVYEALAESDPHKLREELVHVAAVAAQWIEAIDRAV